MIINSSYVLFKKIRLVFFLFASLILSSCEKSEDIVNEDSVSIINSLQIIKDDMIKPHEGEPHGILSIFDWATHPRIGYGNIPPDGWEAMIPWGQIYFDISSGSTSNTRFQIRNIQAWYISKNDGLWKKWVQTSDIGGANFAEDYQNNVNIPADIRGEPDGGGISSTLIEGYNFHFWSNEGKITINPEDIAGVWVSIESRLILVDKQLPDDRLNARFLFNTGADYWESLDAQWDQLTTNGDIGIGRFRFLTNNWQAFNMHTLTEEQLKNNPPPY